MVPEEQPGLDLLLLPSAELEKRYSARGRAAAEGRIEVVLTAAGRDETSEFEIAFLPGHGVARGTVVFETDPRRGTLHARPVGYATP